MATKIEGDNILVPGQVTVQSAPTLLQHVVTGQYVGSLKAYVKNLDLNAAAPSDLAVITIPSARYVPVRVLVYSPTGNLAAATLGLYTAAAAGGTAVVTPTLLNALTATGTFQALSVASLASVLTATALYPRLTVAAGAPGTVSLYIELVDLALI